MIKVFLIASTVHQRSNYDNVFWDGKQMIYGNGDGGPFGNFTKAWDIIGHEPTYGIVQFLKNLTLFLTGFIKQRGRHDESCDSWFWSLCA